MSVIEAPKEGRFILPQRGTRNSLTLSAAESFNYWVFAVKVEVQNLHSGLCFNYLSWWPKCLSLTCKYSCSYFLCALALRINSSFFLLILACRWDLVTCPKLAVCVCESLGWKKYHKICVMPMANHWNRHVGRGVMKTQLSFIMTQISCIQIYKS